MSRATHLSSNKIKLCPDCCLYHHKYCLYFFGILTVFLLVMCRTKTLTKAQHWSYDNCTFQYSTIVYYIYSIYIFTLSTIVDYPRTNVKGIVENRSADKQLIVDQRPTTSQWLAPSGARHIFPTIKSKLDSGRKTFEKEHTYSNFLHASKCNGTNITKLQL